MPTSLKRLTQCEHDAVAKAKFDAINDYNSSNGNYCNRKRWDEVFYEKLKDDYIEKCKEEKCNGGKSRKSKKGGKSRKSRKVNKSRRYKK